MKTTTINNMLSALAMLAMDVKTIDQVASAIDKVGEFTERIKLSLGEDIATHFEILALKILNEKVK